MQVTVISPEASMFDGEADAVVAPAFDGEVGILPNHAPFMTLLGEGTLTVRLAGSTSRFARSWWISPGRGQPGARRGRTRSRRVACVVASGEVSWCSPCSAARSRRPRRRRPVTPVFKAPYRAVRAATSSAPPSPTPAKGSSFAMEGFYSYGKDKNDFGLRAGFADVNGGDTRCLIGGDFRTRVRELQRELPARRRADPRPRGQLRGRRRRLRPPGRHLPGPPVRPGGLEHHLRPLRGTPSSSPSSAAATTA